MQRKNVQKFFASLLVKNCKTVSTTLLCSVQLFIQICHGGVQTEWKQNHCSEKVKTKCLYTRQDNIYHKYSKKLCPPTATTVEEINYRMINMNARVSAQTHVKHRPKMPSEYIDVFEYWEETLQINILHFSITEKSMFQEAN